MNRTVKWIGVGVVFVLCLGVAAAQAQQQPVAAEPQAPGRTVQAPPELVPTLPVPRLVKFSGVAKDELGKPRTGTVGITFAIYKEQEGGAALWLETQNVQLDEQGHYSVLLGGTKVEGLPLELFTSGESRWLGIQVQLSGEVEQPRVLLVSVPYALKAADAETLGGLPASAFVLAQSTGTASGASTSGAATQTSTNSKAVGKAAARGTTKTAAPAAPVAANFIPVFLDNAGTLGSSVMAQSGSNIGIGTTSPAAALHVNGDTLLVTSGTTAQVQFSGALSSARFGQDGSGAFFASDTSGKAVRFYTNNGTLNEGLRIDSSSNVGIGTSAPAARLQVTGTQPAAVTVGNGTNAPDAMRIVGGKGGNTSAFATGGTGGSVLIQGGPGGDGFPTGGTGGSITLQPGAGGFLGSPGNVLMAGTPNKVGIGTSNPTSILHVVGSGITALRVETNANGATLASFGSPGIFDIDASGLAGGRLRVTEAGNVGIGTAAPTHTLEVAAGGTTLADAWTTRSSARLKSNVRPILNALAKVEKLRGVSYDWKTNGKHDIGLIAEEVAQVVPEVVAFEANGKDAQGLDYARLTALLIEAVKQQQVQIRALRSEVELLRRQSAR